MQTEFLVAKIALSILDYGVIDDIDYSIQSDDIDKQLLLFNAIIIPHKNRYERCYTDETRKTECTNFIKNYEKVFQGSFLSVDLVENIFQLITSNDLYSTQFSESCRKLLENIHTCEIVEIRYAILSRIISMIVRCRIYGREPIDTYLRECVDEVDRLHLEYGDIKQISFLE